MSRPGLFKRLEASARATVASAPPGSGKTVLLRSWTGEAGLAERAAWVPVGRQERDRSGSGCRCWARCAARPRGRDWCGVTAAPDLDGWAITERPLTDLVRLQDRLWLVIDDMHELRAGRGAQPAGAADAWPRAGGPACCSTTGRRQRPRLYICGPTPFVEAAAQALVGLGHQPEAIKIERFGPTGS